MEFFASLASIPSPSFNTVEIGPLNLRMYGLCIALGVVAAVTISSRRWEARGGNPDDIGTIALWAVPAGVIGARLYHVATDWKTYRDDWVDALKITQGGLGIPGGIFLGVMAGLIVVRVRKLPALPLLDVVAPAIPVAQALGRLGNWFNQEVFGRPTSLPWGLRIDPEFRPAGDESSPTFHPTFLYEGLWNIGLAVGLVMLERRKKLRPGQLFTLYVLGYAVGRLWVEMLRSDHASLIAGIRINIWMSIIVGLLALAVFLRNRNRPWPPGLVPGPDGVAVLAGGPMDPAGPGDVVEVVDGDEPEPPPTDSAERSPNASSAGDGLGSSDDP